MTSALGLASLLPDPVVAFLGRVSDKGLQDPSLSIPRQLKEAEPVAIELGGRITRFY